jgi:mRNA-degrading endonuclease toxin of MazEF toxin-antitoxin module
MVINQGDLYWVPLEDPIEPEPDDIHPQVVIQENVLNHSRIHTVVVCALTTNMERAKAPAMSCSMRVKPIYPGKVLWSSRRYRP